MNSFVWQRVAALMAVVVLGYVLTVVVEPLSDLIGVEDGLQFFLSSIVFASAWKASLKFFTERPVKFSRLLSLGILFWAMSFMLGSVWSVTWRAFGYDPTVGDNGLRFWFRYCAIVGSLCSIAAPELFEQEISSDRLGKLAVGLGCIFMTVLLLVYGNRLARNITHDTAPSLTETPYNVR